MEGDDELEVELLGKVHKVFDVLLGLRVCANVLVVVEYERAQLQDILFCIFRRVA